MKANSPEYAGNTSFRHCEEGNPEHPHQVISRGFGRWSRSRCSYLSPSDANYLSAAPVWTYPKWLSNFIHVVTGTCNKVKKLNPWNRFQLLLCSFVPHEVPSRPTWLWSYDLINCRQSSCAMNSLQINNFQRLLSINRIEHISRRNHNMHLGYRKKSMMFYFRYHIWAMRSKQYCNGYHWQSRVKVVHIPLICAFPNVWISSCLIQTSWCRSSVELVFYFL